MIIQSLLLVPAVAAVFAWFIRRDALRRTLLVAVASVHLGLVGAAWIVPPTPVAGGWLVLDAAGRLMLSITSLLFLATAVYGFGYLRREGGDWRRDFEEGLLFANAPEQTFSACLLLFLAAMTLVSVSVDQGLLWVAIEATTLASAPLIYFHRHHRSLEATWKYLLVCSVGLALALLGNFAFGVAGAVGAAGSAPGLPPGAAVDGAWVRLGFILILVGYGTKMGLAPLHTWLPDAHSEAPSMVSALLSGALLNCAFMGILRGVQLCAAVGEGRFAQELLVTFGLVSIGVAAALIPGQRDYKRMLAYSSVEHMGILALGVGIGGAALFGVFLHAIAHSLTKGMLFLLAGNVLTAYRTKAPVEVSGVARRLPVSGALWIAGLFSITGTPPFATFLSELVIIKAAIDQGRIVVAGVVVALLAVIFVAMARIMLQMGQGLPGDAESGTPVNPEREPLWSVLPPAVLALSVLCLGLYVPGSLQRALEEAARLIHG